MSVEHEDDSSCETDSDLLIRTDVANIGDDNEDTGDDNDDEDEENNHVFNGVANYINTAAEEECDAGDDDEEEDEEEEEEDDDDDDEDDGCNGLDVKPSELQISHNCSTLHDVTKIRWPPGSWQDGTRKSAFQPYRPTMVLTNLQRGNIPTETSVPEQTDVSLHHRAGQGEITQQDVEQEYDINIKDNNGLSALMWASAYGQFPTVQLLLQHGALIDLEGQEGETSLLLAAAGGHHEVVRLLLTEGAAVNHEDEAVCLSHPILPAELDVVLRQKRLQINIGNTALMYAAYGDHPHCTNELLLRGADITVVNVNGDTAFGIAVKRGSKLAQAVIENYLLTLLS